MISQNNSLNFCHSCHASQAQIEADEPGLLKLWPSKSVKNESGLFKMIALSTSTADSD